MKKAAAIIRTSFILNTGTLIEGPHATIILPPIRALSF
jgi:hypothetical protein